MPKLGTKKQAAPKHPVLLFEGRPNFMSLLALAIEMEPGLCVCGQVKGVRTVLEAISRLRPVLIVMDLFRPTKIHLRLLKEIHGANPELKLLVVSTRKDSRFANTILQAGATGYILESEGLEEIIQAIHDVLHGAIYLSEAVLTRRPGTRSTKRGS
jgi:DNA-binding NarL/FixJ family response regulator